MASPGKTIWFGVQVTIKDKKQACILYLTFEKKLFHLIKKGQIDYTAEFGMCEKVQKDATSLGVQLQILGRGLLDIRTQSEDDRDLLFLLLDKIVSGFDGTVTESLLSSHNSLVPLLSGPAQKKGKLTWSKRFLTLHRWGLLVYRTSSYHNTWPLNIIILENAIFTLDNMTITITTKFRDYRFYFDDKEKAENWLKAFNQLAALRS
eukprot:TRINITY_DN12599_c0_g1_i1.p1 TRINITY_DN12599_c0_g1~~TRINITY_DN12599_c0_g1_i1.p1  ORF type:complete len:206 (-),score=39.89 TRINITY_DN12599_c0_g1_i1:85-702(-)